jgi:predicted GIY-YIG superfamily endonuclease
MTSPKDFDLEQGYRETFSFNDWGLRYLFDVNGCNGVLINPDLADFDNPEFIEALKKAHSEWHEWNEAYQLALEPLPENLSEWNHEETMKFAEEGPTLCEVTKLDHFQFDEAIRSSLIEKHETVMREHVRKQEIMILLCSHGCNSKSPKVGYVYLIRAESGLYKIGRTTSPQNRMKTFGIKLPFQVEYECLILTYDMVGTERALHQHFASKHMNGEWFRLTPEDVKYIKDYAGGDQ